MMILVKKMCRANPKHAHGYTRMCTHAFKYVYAYIEHVHACPEYAHTCRVSEYLKGKFLDINSCRVNPTSSRTVLHPSMITIKGLKGSFITTRLIH